VALQRNGWSGSAHANAAAEPFNHWNEDGPLMADGTGGVNKSCARCHSTGGYRDYLGEDGTDPFVVDNNAPLGTTIECDACHNDAASALSEVFFPSGAHVTGLGKEARCMTCHQGRESTVSLDAHIATVGAADEHTVSTDYSFKNVHYFAAGATLYGGQAMGAAQFPGKLYNGLSTHVADYNVCIECHNPHTLKVRFDECAVCHPGVTDGDTARDLIRMKRSIRDYDGDQNVTEGIAREIDGLAAILYRTIRDYAMQVSAQGITYDGASYPYWFNDNNNDDVNDGDGSFDSWTATLLRAGYNYQYYQKDPGAFAHNRKYVIEFLYDSIEALASHALIDVPELPMLWRNDTGHFDTSADAYRHWDSAPEEDGSIVRGEVDAACARCHSPEGFDFWAEYGIDITRGTQVADGLSCETCHEDFASNPADPPRKLIPTVEFPSGVAIMLDDADAGSAYVPIQDDSFICMSCHKGRESQVQVDERIAQGKPTFRNVHYLPAGAIMFGADAGVAYEYGNNGAYAEKWNHMSPDGPGISKSVSFAGAQCVYCHLEDHSFAPQFKAATCGAVGCHDEATDLHSIRKNRATDYDGDADSTEPLMDEVQTFADRLYDAMKARAIANANDHIVYDAGSYPYWFQDNDDDGVPDVDGDGKNISFGNWTDALSKAAFNYQIFQKEPGAWAHNTPYILQILYDGIDDLGGNLTGLTRP
jgi:hypothetical protein